MHSPLFKSARIALEDETILPNFLSFFIISTIRDGAGIAAAALMLAAIDSFVRAPHKCTTSPRKIPCNLIRLLQHWFLYLHKQSCSQWRHALWFLPLCAEWSLAWSQACSLTAGSLNRLFSVACEIKPCCGWTKHKITGSKIGSFGEKKKERMYISKVYF